MVIKNDLTGKTINRLTILKLDEEKSNTTNRSYWICKCSCGNIKSIRGDLITSGKIQSCGCLNKEIVSKTHSKHNEININKDLGYAEVYLNNSNLFFKCDIEDLDIVKQYCWHKSSDNYICAYNRDKDKKEGQVVFFHKLVMEKKYGSIDNDHEVDHINHDTFDNRKYSNLRICTHSENMKNRCMPSISNTGHKNISYDNTNKRYCVLFYNSNQIYRRYYKNLDDAIIDKNNYIATHPEIKKFEYNSEIDIRNRNSNKIFPFTYINNQPVMRNIISPFIIVDDNKFYRYQSQ